jgi:hypothetical protein
LSYLLLLALVGPEPDISDPAVSLEGQCDSRRGDAQTTGYHRVERAFPVHLQDELSPAGEPNVLTVSDVFDNPDDSSFAALDKLGNSLSREQARQRKFTD